MTDAEILEGLKDGHADAVTEMLDRHGDRLLRSAYLMCGNETEAQDLSQETLLQAVRSAHRCRGTSSLYTWLHGILRNVTFRHFRKRRRLTFTDRLPERPVAVAGPQMLDLATVSLTLLTALQALKPKHREVVILRYYEEMRIHDMATHLGVRSGTVKSRLFYALKQLRHLLPSEMNLFGTSGTEG